MNAGQLKQACYDRLGVTSPDSTTVTMVERAINQAKHEVTTLARWSWRERSIPFRFTPSTQDFACWGPVVSSVSNIAEVLDVEDGLGVPLVWMERDSFEDAFRGNTSTASNPKFWTVAGMSYTTSVSAAAPVVSIWPRIATTTTNGTLRYLMKDTEFAAGDVTSVPEAPEEWHWIIEAIALAKIYEWEDSELAPAMRKNANDALATLAASTQNGAIDARI